MVQAGIGKRREFFDPFSNQTRLLATIAVALGLFFPVSYSSLQTRPVNWRPITVASRGFTNSAWGLCTVLEIRNHSAAPLKLLHLGYMEFYSQVLNGTGNQFRKPPAGTRLVLKPGQAGLLLLPVSDEGNSWNFYFDFARLGLRTRMAEHIQKSGGIWLRCLPESLTTVSPLHVYFYLSRREARGRFGP